MLVDVHAQPGAKRDEVAGLFDGRVRVRTVAPPEAGRANRRIAEVVAALFGLRRADVELVGGATSRRKSFALHGVTIDEARRRLEVAVGDGAGR